MGAAEDYVSDPCLAKEAFILAIYAIIPMVVSLRQP